MTMRARPRPSSRRQRTSRKFAPELADGWIACPQAAALLQRTDRRIRQMVDEGRLYRARRDEHGRLWISPCCVRAEIEQAVCECRSSSRTCAEA